MAEAPRHCAVAYPWAHQEQYYSGKADWDIIKSGEGGTDPCRWKRGYLYAGGRRQDAKETGCDGIMVAMAGPGGVESVAVRPD